MFLTDEQKSRFRRDGFLLLRNAVPATLRDPALAKINALLGEGFDPARREIFAAQSYFPELRETDLICDLVRRSDVWKAAEALVGPRRLEPVRQGQLALRFPQTEPRPASQLKGHLDGIPNGTNGVPEGTFYTFTLLAGIALSATTGPNQGNFTVWPGSHLLWERWFRENDPMTLLEKRPDLPFGEPLQIEWQPGDAILALHPLLHGIAPNHSPNIRYATFYRLQHVEHTEKQWDALRDVWLEFDGLREPAGPA